MSAIGAYVSACRYTFQCDIQDESSWLELERHLRALRGQLTCCVCGLIIYHAIGPAHSACMHHVCEGCRDGKMRLRPACGWCGDRKEFIEKPQLDILVQCYRKLCDYIASFGVKCESLAPLIREGSTAHATSSSASSGSQAAEAPPPPLIPPVYEVQKPKKSTRGPRKHKRGKRNSLKVRINLRNVEGGDEAGSSHFVMQDSRHNNRSKETSVAEVSTTTVTPEDNDPVKEMPHSTTSPVGVASYDTEEQSSFAALNHSDLVESSMLDDTPELGSYGDISDSAFGDIYSTVAVEHDYIHRGDVLSEDENKTDTKAHRKYKAKGSLVTIIKKTKIVNVMNDDDQNSTPSPRTEVKNKQSRGAIKKGSGCRCGLATPNPGKLTCCGQRCPCYSAFKGCVDCRCRGCRNPRGDITKQIMSPLLCAQPKQTDESDVDAEIKID